jgi:uncharacterized protein YeaO (DUF488 family)
MKIRIKRVYEQSDKHDGRRILVDRLWPRGLTKKKQVLICGGSKTLPSIELRKWFGHNTGRWEEFNKRYISELKGNSEPAVSKKSAHPY